MYKKFNVYMLFVFFLLIFNTMCKNENQGNHIDKYKINVDSLQILPDGFYTFWRGSVFYEDLKSEKYTIWFKIDNKGNVEKLIKIQDINDEYANENEIINKYKIDTSFHKNTMQRFVKLSRKYKFGRIKIDRDNIISFSYKRDVSKEYVRTFNDSIKNIYLKDMNFVLLNNGWFEYIKK